MTVRGHLFRGAAKGIETHGDAENVKAFQALPRATISDAI